MTANTTHNKTLLHLSLISGIGPHTIKKLLNHDLSKFYLFSKQDFMHQCGLSEKIAENIVQGLKKASLLSKERQLIEKYNIKLLTIIDNDYPHELKEIHSPPPVLYYKGAPFTKMAKRIAFVGSRKATKYAEKVIKNLIPPLIENGWEIVSGGAIGADCMAHVETLRSGGTTLVVFGSGLLHSYPKENTSLFRSIVNNGGTIISSFPLQTTPHKGLFPTRNRIIAGLCAGSIVVQAAKRSGALITAQFALDQGRQVFAIPGAVHDELSVGCHELIKQGAKLVATANDIFEEFGEKVSRTSNNMYTQKKIIVNQNKLDTKESTIIQSKTIKLENPNIILQALEKPSSLDELQIKTGMKFNILHTKLFDLQLAGMVKQNFAGLWERIQDDFI